MVVDKRTASATPVGIPLTVDYFDLAVNVEYFASADAPLLHFSLRKLPYPKKQMYSKFKIKGILNLGWVRMG